MSEISRHTQIEAASAAQTSRKPFAGVTPKDTLNRWSDAFLYHPNVQEGDALYLPIALKGIKGVRSVRFTTYGTDFRTASYPAIKGLAAHRVQLAARSALLHATFAYDEVEGPRAVRYRSYAVAKPGEMLPAHNPFQFGALLGCTWQEVDDAVGAAAVESDYQHRLTAAELCERLGRSELIETLDTPRIFVGVSRQGGGETADSILQPWPAHEEHHRRIQLLTDAVALPPS